VYELNKLANKDSKDSKDSKDCIVISPIISAIIVENIRVSYVIYDVAAGKGFRNAL
jgi:hypothetical protein